MHKIIISLICCLLPTFAFANTLAIRENAPERHVVVKGDTLWDISATFFKDPWKWPQIWKINKESIKDPHWIYPGDVIVLDRNNGTLNVEHLSARPVVKLSPSVRKIDSNNGAIPTISSKDITPFLSRALVIEKDDLENEPTIVGTFEQRVILGNNDIAYVSKLPSDKGTHWQVYRMGDELVDPDTNDSLGYEAKFLGDAIVEKFDKLSRIRIQHAILAIAKGDHLLLPSETIPSNYIPHAPEKKINARVMSIYGGGTQTGSNSVITINKGSRDGLENGHVLALYRKGEEVDNDITLPPMRYGLLLVFRTFEKASYALVMQTTLPVELRDNVRTP